MRRKVKQTLAILMALALVTSFTVTDGFSSLAQTEKLVDAGGAAETTAEMETGSAEALAEEPTTEALTEEGTSGSGQETGAGETTAEETTASVAGKETQSTAESSSSQAETGQTETLTSAAGEGEKVPESSEGEKKETTASAAQTTTAAESTAAAITAAETETTSQQAQTTEAETEETGTEEEYAEYTAYLAEEGITVKARTKVGVFPEGVKMTVTPVKNVDEENKIAETLEQSAVTYDGFLAMDISFMDGTQEIEPEDGTVEVSFELDAALLPEDADVSTLEVQHLKEEGETIKVETVADTADASDGVVEVTGNAGDAAVEALFQVESFSTFVITWANDSGWWKYFQITVHYVDETGAEIGNTASQDVSIKGNSGKINLKESYGNNISGYKYIGAYYQTYNGIKITDLEPSEQQSGAGWSQTTTRKIKFYYGDEVEDTIEYESYSFQTVTRDIYLVYEETGGTVTPPVTPDKQLTHDKYVVYDPETDTYDLNLTVSGAVGSETNKVKMDVLLIIDTSRSMGFSWGRTTRIAAVASAVKSFTDTLSNNKNLDVRYSVVGFSGPTSMSTQGSSRDANVIQGWTNNATTVNNSISRISPNGGTNYQAGINRGITQLATARTDAQRIVIFLTDGVPTVRNGEKPCDDDEWTKIIQNNTAAVDAIEGMSANAFYCIGADSDFSDISSQPYKNLQALCNAVKADEDKKAVYSANDANSLNDAFKEIVGDTTTILCDHVTITDTLSEYAEMVMKSDGTPQKLVVSINNQKGEVIESPAESIDLDGDGTLTPEYKDGTITLKFPENYKLDGELTYIVTATIQATDKAYEEYQRGGYLHTGENGTGENSAGKDGFYSNKIDGATVTYTFDGKTTIEEYPKPVIQVYPGKLVIEKTISGLGNDSTALSELKKKLSFNITVNGRSTSVKLSAFTEDSATGSYTYTMDKLKPGVTYTVTEDETTATIDNYDVVTTGSPSSGTITKNGRSEVKITNTYTKSVADLTITKAVNGLEDIQNKDMPEFTFTIQTVNTAFNGTYTYEKSDKTTDTVTAINGEATVTIQGSGSVTLKDLPLGNYTVTETRPATAPEGYYFDTADAELSKTATLSKNTPGSVTITNTYKPEKSVTVLKRVTGNMGDPEESFDFTVKVDGETVINSYGLKTAADGTISLKDGGTFELTGLKDGQKVEIIETDYTSSGYRTYVLDGLQEDKITIAEKDPSSTFTIESVEADAMVTFVNDNTVKVPTGIHSTTLPFLLMLLFAFGGAAIFLLTRRGRRRSF